MKKKRVLLFYTLGLCLYAALFPIDATVTQTIIHHRYQFSSGELADGLVYFKKGFDVPPGGTVFLRLAPGIKVDGNINFHGGTIIFNDDVAFGDVTLLTGSGFLTFSDKTLRFFNDIVCTGTITFVGENCFVRGVGGGTLILDQRDGFGVLDLTQASTVQFASCSILLTKESFITSNGKPNHLSFNSSLVRTSGGLGDVILFLNPHVEFLGDSSLLSGFEEIVFDQQLTVAPFSQLNLSVGALVRIGGLSVQGFGSALVVQSSILDFASYTFTSNPLLIGSQIEEQGSLVIDGKSILRASNGNDLELASDLTLELVSGARLAIDPGFKFSIL